MSLIEFIGFIVTFFVFIIMSVRRMKEKREMASVEEDDALRDYLRSVGIETEEAPAVRPPPPPVKKKLPKAKPVEKHVLSEAPEYEVIAKNTTSEADNIINNQSSIENLVIAQIILGPPKAYE